MIIRKNAMTFTHKFLFISGIISLQFFSCREQLPVDGGPCSYKTNKSPATIIAIVPHDSTCSEIYFSVEKEGKRDTISYSRYFTGWACKDVIEKYDLKMGNVFTFEEHEEIKGTCDPYYYSLTLEKYREEK
jgi:hypothetical protein